MLFESNRIIIGSSIQCEIPKSDILEVLLCLPYEEDPVVRVIISPFVWLSPVVTTLVINDQQAKVRQPTPDGGEKKWDGRRLSSNSFTDNDEAILA